MNQQSTSEVVTRLRKQEEEDRLKMMLQKLTEEMRAQHYGNEISSTKDIPEEVVVAKEDTKDYKTRLSLPTSTPKENTRRSTPSLLVTEAANKSSGSSKNNSVVSKISNEESAASFMSKASSKSKVRDHHHTYESKSVKSVDTIPSKSLRSQVEQVSFRHQQVLDSIKSCQPDILDGPNILTYEKSWTAKPDNFNVMSTARRVLKSEDDHKTQDGSDRTDDDNDEKVSEINHDLTLSEGPLNTDSESDSDYKKSNFSGEKSKSISQKEFDELPVRDKSRPPEKVLYILQDFSELEFYCSSS